MTMGCFFSIVLMTVVCVLLLYLLLQFQCFFSCNALTVLNFFKFNCACHNDSKSLSIVFYSICASSHLHRSLSTSLPPHSMDSMALTESTVRWLSGSLEKKHVDMERKKKKNQSEELLEKLDFFFLKKGPRSSVCAVTSRRQPAGSPPAGRSSLWGRWCGWWAGAC